LEGRNWIQELDWITGHLDWHLRGLILGITSTLLPKVSYLKIGGFLGRQVFRRIFRRSGILYRIWHFLGNTAGTTSRRRIFKPKPKILTLYWK